MVSRDAFLEDFHAFKTNLMKRIQRLIDVVDRGRRSGSLEDIWQIEQSDSPRIRSHTFRGYYESQQPLEPLDPIDPLEPLSPVRPRPFPKPKRPFIVSESALREKHEPLTDIFDEEKQIRIYIEVPIEEKNHLQLNVSTERVEVKASNFYKMINLPASNIDIEKASSICKNGVLEVIIPKMEKPPEHGATRISIE